VPITASGFLRSPNFSTHSRAMIAPAMGLAIMSRNQAKGSFRVKRTVYLSGASTLAMERNIDTLLPLSARMYSNV
jgi:hypothetical protein